MSVKLPDNASDILKRGSQYVIDNSPIFIYSLSGVTSSQVKAAGDRATESYARKVLNWPNGRLAKPDILTAASETSLKTVDECAEHYITHLRDLYQLEETALSTYPHAFVVISKDCLPDNAATILACEKDGKWSFEQVALPIEVELGMSLENLRMGDISTQDILDKHGEGSQKASRSKGAKSEDSRVFAVFSTGLEAALPLPALIDPATDKVQPSEATLDLIADPANSQFCMSRNRMLELFPIICRDDEARDWRTKSRQLHKQIFICCDNDTPKDKGVLIIRMDWDLDTKQDDETLRKAGSEAKLQETRAGIKEALAKARELADNI